MKIAHQGARTSVSVLAVRSITALFFAAIVLAGIAPLGRKADPNFPGLSPAAHAGGSYTSLASGNLNFSISPSTTNGITSNDNWSGFTSVEGYFGQNLTATHGVDPQTVLGTEFAANTLPNTPPQVAANKGNPNAFNAGGLAEFDSGPYLAIGFQGNVQANPYLVFFVNTLNRANVTISYEVTDIDSGSNNAVSRLALQYRTGPTGLFTNIPAGYIADATDGPNIGGRVTSKSVMLPSDAWNKPQVQIRLITTNAANTSGSSTPDEWIGVNNVVVSSLAPTSAPVEVMGRVLSDTGRSVAGAYVYAFDEAGTTRFAVTNSFGYYRFTGLTAGSSYTLTVRSKLYRFETLFVSPTENLSGVNFVAIPQRIISPPSRSDTTSVSKTSPVNSKGKFDLVP